MNCIIFFIYFTQIRLKRKKDSLFVGEEKHTLKQTVEFDMTDKVAKMRLNALQVLLSTNYKFEDIPESLEKMSANKAQMSPTNSDVICIDDSPVSGSGDSIHVSPVTESSSSFSSSVQSRLSHVSGWYQCILYHHLLSGDFACCRPV